MQDGAAGRRRRLAAVAVVAVAQRAGCCDWTVHQRMCLPVKWSDCLSDCVASRRAQGLSDWPMPVGCLRAARCAAWLVVLLAAGPSSIMMASMREGRETAG